MLITLKAPADADSATVRRDIYDRLMSDDSFCGEGGRFGSPLCDWFVIGGRWSGLLRETIGDVGPGPYDRTGYEDHGFPDDAMPLTTELYEALLAEYQGDSIGADGYADLDNEELQPDFVGRKWIVVVDYHS